MAALPTTNQAAQGIDNAIQSGGSSIISLAENMIIADVPFLGFPIIKQIWEALFNFIAGYFEKAAETGATFAVIDAQTASESSNLSQALQALITAEKSGNAAAIQQAIQNYAKANSALINSDGSASV